MYNARVQRHRFPPQTMRITRSIPILMMFARDLRGEIRIYPIAENVHRRHILHTTRAPAPMAS